MSQYVRKLFNRATDILENNWKCPLEKDIWTVTGDGNSNISQGPYVAFVFYYSGYLFSLEIIHIHIIPCAFGLSSNHKHGCANLHILKTSRCVLVHLHTYICVWHCVYLCLCRYLYVSVVKHLQNRKTLFFHLAYLIWSTIQWELLRIRKHFSVFACVPSFSQSRLPISPRWKHYWIVCCYSSHMGSFQEHFYFLTLSFI